MIDLKIASKTFLQIEFFVCLIGSKNQRYNKGWMLFSENMYTCLLSKYLYIDINIYMFTFCCSFFFFLSFSFSMSLAWASFLASWSCRFFITSSCFAFISSSVTRPEAFIINNEFGCELDDMMTTVQVNEVICHPSVLALTSRRKHIKSIRYYDFVHVGMENKKISPIVLDFSCCSTAS